jgi:hypothetical protein
VTLVAAANTWVDMAVDASNVYWDEDTGPVVSCSINGCSAPATIYTPPSGFSYGLVAPLSPMSSSYVQNVYSMISDPDNVVDLVQIPKSGMAPTAGSLNLYSAGGLAFDPTNTWFYSVDSGGGTEDLVRMKPDGSQLTYVLSNILPNFGATFYLGIDSTNVYVPDSGNSRVVYCPLTGSCGSGYVSMSGITYPRAVYSDGTSVWVVASGASAAAGSILKCSVGVNCGAPTPFASGQNTPWAVVADSQNVYWTNSATAGQLMRCPVAGCGGTPTVWVTGLNGPYAMTQDANAVYFLDSIGLRKVIK